MLAPHVVLVSALYSQGLICMVACCINTAVIRDTGFLADMDLCF